MRISIPPSHTGSIASNKFQSKGRYYVYFFFFFQAEDGIRDYKVTGVQTCALPIFDHFQWIVALTRIISAVFRKGGDVTFLVDELKAVFDPRGGYWQPGGKFMPSIIAELGYVIEKHLQTIGLIRKTQLDPHQQRSEERRVGKECRSRGAAYH